MTSSLMRAWQRGCRIRLYALKQSRTVQETAHLFNVGMSTAHALVRLREQYSFKEIQLLDEYQVPLSVVKTVASVKNKNVRWGLLLRYWNQMYDRDDLREIVRTISARAKKGKGERSNG